MKFNTINHHHSYAEIKNIYRKETKSRKKQHFLAVLMMFEDKQIPKIAQYIHVHATNVRIWIRKWN
jgi:hypothetical protein